MVGETSEKCVRKAFQIEKVQLPIVKSCMRALLGNVTEQWPQSIADTRSRVDVDISLIEDRGHTTWTAEPPTPSPSQQGNLVFVHEPAP